MKKILSALAIGALLTGCTPDEKASTATSSVPPTVWQGSGDMTNTTLHKYIVDNDISEFPFRPEEPGTPKVDFPMPPDWSDAGAQTPEWAYGAIKYDKAADPDDPPTLIAIASKLTGDVDPEKILEYAPGQLNELPEFTAIGEPEKDSLGGFEAIDYAGTYMWEGKKRIVGQQTIVVPGKDAVYVLQLNGDALDGQQDVVLDAAKVIADQTKITVPS